LLRLLLKGRQNEGSNSFWNDKGTLWCLHQTPSRMVLALPWRCPHCTINCIKLSPAPAWTSSCHVAWWQLPLYWAVQRSSHLVSSYLQIKKWSPYCACCAMALFCSRVVLILFIVRK